MIDVRPARFMVERRDRAGQIHLGHEPAAEDVPVRIGVGRHGDGAQRRLAPLRRLGRGVLTIHMRLPLEGLLPNLPQHMVANPRHPYCMLRRVLDAVQPLSI